jgi:hypothetical protein
MKIFDEILKIRDKYDDGESYSEYRYEKTDDDNEVEFKFEDELKEFCESNNINYKYYVEDAYDSCGYDCRVGAIAFIDENSELQLVTVLYEYY